MDVDRVVDLVFLFAGAYSVGLFTGLTVRVLHQTLEKL